MISHHLGTHLGRCHNRNVENMLIYALLRYSLFPLEVGWQLYT